MQDRIKELAEEHLHHDKHGHYGDDSQIEAFVQAVARECAGIVEAKSVSSYRATELAANAIRARFGIAEE